MTELSILDSPDSTERKRYEFRTNGPVQKSMAMGASINDPDDIDDDGQGAHGYIVGGIDSYTIDGEITSFQVTSGDASTITVYVNGSSVPIDSVARASEQISIISGPTDEEWQAHIEDPEAHHIPPSVTVGGGGGVGITPDPQDHHQGIQDIIDDTTGQVVIDLVPGAKYTGEGIQLRDHVKIRGHYADVVTESNTDRPLLHVPDPGGENLNNLYLGEINFHGNAQNNNSETDLAYLPLYHSVVERCRFTNAAGRAFWLNQGGSSNDDNVFRDCRFDHCGRKLGGSSRDYAVMVGTNRDRFSSIGVTSFRKCWFGNNRSPIGYLGLRGNTNVVTDCKFFGNSGESECLIGNHTGDHNRITNCDLVADPVADGVRLEAAGATMRRNIIANSAFWMDFDVAVRLDTGSGGEMRGTMVNDNVFDVDENRGGTSALKAEPGNYTKCMASDNIVLGNWDDAIDLNQSGWTTSGNVT